MCASQHDSSVAFVLTLERNEVLHSLSPSLSLIVPPWPALSLYAIMAKGWPSPTSSRTQQVRSFLDVLIPCHGQPGFTAYFSAPPGATGERRAFLIDMWISVREPKRNNNFEAGHVTQGSPIPELSSNERHQPQEQYSQCR